MEFDEFVQRIGALLDVEILEPINPESSLYDDIGLDSFQAFQLLIVVESLADCTVPPIDIPELFTLADAFEYYQELRASTGNVLP
jgi:acyl carrier protein